MYNLQGVRPVGIEETLRRSIYKLVMRAVGNQAKKAYRSLQLCAGLEAGIEEATHNVAQGKAIVPEGRGVYKD